MMRYLSLSFKPVRPQGRKRQPLNSITGMRIAAALLVVSHHLLLPDSARTSLHIKNALENGMFGVDFFFVLSGFILTYTYLSENDISTDVKTFWFARWSKIYPIYLLGMALYLPIIIVKLGQTLHGYHLLFRLILSFTSSALLLQAWVPQLALLWNGPGWSLSDEAFFYFIFPFILPFANGRWLLTLWLFTFLPTLLVNLITSGSLTSNTAVPPFIDLIIKFNPILRMPEFLAGIVLCKWAIQNGRLVRGLHSGYFLASLVITVFTLALSPPWLLQVLALPISLTLVYTAAQLGAKKSFFGGATVVRLGEASYAVYILHIPLAGLLALSGLMPPITGRFGWPAFGPFIALLLLVSLFVLSKIELPMQRWLRKKWQR